jgi:polysaccharide export outer membrane protein
VTAWLVAASALAQSTETVQQKPGQQPPPAQAKPAVPQKPAPPLPAARKPAAPQGVVPPPSYVIGPDDQLSIVFWKDKDMTSDVVVRPDGKISLPLLNDVQAAGLTPEELRLKITEEARRFIEDPNVTVVVRQIISLRVYITGEVAKPGPYLLTSGLTVLQLIAVAGGLTEYADRKKIMIMRTENGRQATYRFNYKEVVDRKNLKQNIELKPGDTVIVP